MRGRRAEENPAKNVGRLAWAGYGDRRKMDSSFTIKALWAGMYESILYWLGRTNRCMVPIR